MQSQKKLFHSTDPESCDALKGHKILVTGGTGFIGKPLLHYLMAKGTEIIVLTRDAAKKATANNASVTYITNLSEIADSDKIDAIVNLAGEPLAAKRWSEQRKELFIASRIGTTRNLLALVERLHDKPHVLVNGSAIGYYGPQDASELGEDADFVDCFAHRLCQQWENEAQKFEPYGLRVCCLRIGIVLGSHGGPLQELRKSFDFKIATQMGQGDQWMSWIHIEDLIRIIGLLLVSPDIDGPVNGTAPTPVTNREFCDIFSTIKQPLLKISLPAWLLRIIIGEMSDEVLVTGQRVIPRKLLDYGFNFQYPRLGDALKSLLGE